MARLLTNSLVCIGACLFVMLSMMMEEDSSPTRLIAQVVSGIGFLAGGVILREGSNIRGLNTAATIWCTAAIGALTGSGFIFKAFIGAIIVIFAHLFLTPLGDIINETSLRDKPSQKCYLCTITCSREHECNLREKFLNYLEQHKSLELRSMHSGKLASVNIEVKNKANIVAINH
ncbi:Mg(2+) transport ATPase protein C [Geminocystis sp. NIES-3708]|uniref:MgtC/SapB family protein n=1 Tax=Geminocystis sp. NIES-3708 TaxID=1615909 RepID=UPI0005FCB81E|nr:MgtC/SapB family protein [Geminocystis sp. NIES-3708]BAQ60393.1 Mg(2+) transport ATPase protein C [Geminocystis sp. NIES-3708]